MGVVSARRKIDTSNNVDEEEDDNKYSKRRRDSENFLTKFLGFVAVLTVLALYLGSLLYMDASEEQHHLQLELQKQMFHERESQLEQVVEDLDQKVRARKAVKGVHMEVDPQGMKLTKKLQKATLELLEHRYKANPEWTRFRVAVDVHYPDSITTDPSKKNGTLVIEMAPYTLIPCSVFYFLEEARTFLKGEFNRNAAHVLQTWVQTESTKGKRNDNSMPFQEYSPEFPHKQYTTGYAGRPSGPEWYVSIMDNTDNHGPGTQQKENPYEADSNFGKIVDEPSNYETIKMIHSVPQEEWLDDKNCIIFTQMTILINSREEPDVFTEWTMPML